MLTQRIRLGILIARAGDGRQLTRSVRESWRNVFRSGATVMFDPVFDLVEESLDAVALAVEGAAETVTPATVGLGRNIRCGTGRFDAAAEPIGTVSLVGQEDHSLAQAVAKTCGGGTVGRSARSAHQFLRQAARVRKRLCLGRQSSSATAHTTNTTALSVLAVC